ncbi:MAG TPA: hypothetical protein VKC54_03925 [Patescibacteria group bacterium]|nr:hypothetical protein [Patescibacteria group bacterium]
MLAAIDSVDIGNKFFGGSNPLGRNDLTGIGGLVSLFLNISFVIAGVILLFFFILGGIGMIASAGQSDPQKAEQAKKTVTSALIGFIVVFASYWIVQLLGTLTGFTNILGP